MSRTSSTSTFCGAVCIRRTYRGGETLKPRKPLKTKKKSKKSSSGVRTAQIAQLRFRVMTPRGRVALVLGLVLVAVAMLAGTVTGGSGQHDWGPAGARPHPTI